MRFAFWWCVVVLLALGAVALFASDGEILTFNSADANSVYTVGTGGVFLGDSGRSSEPQLFRCKNGHLLFGNSVPVVKAISKEGKVVKLCPIEVGEFMAENFPSLEELESGGAGD